MLAIIIPSIAMSINNFLLIYEELREEKKKNICIARKLQVFLELFGTFSSWQYGNTVTQARKLVAMGTW